MWYWFGAQATFWKWHSQPYRRVNPKDVAYFKSGPKNYNLATFTEVVFKSKIFFRELTGFCLPPAMQMLISTILGLERSAAEVANIFKQNMTFELYVKSSIRSKYNFLILLQRLFFSQILSFYFPWVFIVNIDLT